MLSEEGQDLNIFVISDFTGETAHSVALAAARQFPDKRIKFTRYRYLKEPDMARQVCELAKESGAVIVCTLVEHKIRACFRREAQRYGVEVVDIFGPLMDAFSSHLGVSPLEEPGLMHQMDEAYFKRVKAIEYSITCDDGSNPHLLGEADLVILGVSRTCKTPLSMYLANKGYRTGNIPLVPELDPPEQLFQIPRGRIVGLVIDPNALMQIRRERLQMLGLDPEKASYAQRERVEKELVYARSIMNRVDATVFDVTGRAIEETAQEVLDFIGSNS
ncbi:kinase/pyrophosphorylase [Dethiosulfovibrio sp. F2B]|uniref:pyruvate, water dikinase regulatory protein n=1 Tax=Dethiosulfovibrio faecalis TaxID=2720018 RepID=UPI001F3BA561|nr:kinase/pyrophosphorylase [Dethiosulfovibrio faecalis]